MTFFKSTTPFLTLSLILAVGLAGCEPATEQTQDPSPTAKAEDTAVPKKDVKMAKADIQNAGMQTLVWEDLMPDGEDKILEELYSDFYVEQEMRMIEQMQGAGSNLSNSDFMSMVQEGSAQDTMEQIGTYNVVDELDGMKVRMPGYVVPLDFKASSEYDEFLLVPYFGACLHTPPPPPNQIVYVKSSPKVKIANTYEPVWIEGIMKTGKFGSDLANSAYELNLTKLEPYEYR